MHEASPPARPAPTSRRGTTIFAGPERSRGSSSRRDERVDLVIKHGATDTNILDREVVVLGDLDPDTTRALAGIPRHFDVDVGDGGLLSKGRSCGADAGYGNR